MRKIVLGNNPKSFESDVDVTLPDGEKTTIRVTYKYRTRKELAAFMQSINLDVENIEKYLDMKNAVANTEESLQEDADMLMGVIEGWNLDSEFNRENVLQFCDELPAAVMDIVTHYLFGVKKLRQKN